MIDYHIHSTHSGDSVADMASVCEIAIERSLSEIAFTEHIDFEPTDLCYGSFNYELYKQEIDKARNKYGDKLIIRMGVEVDFQSKYSSQIRDFLDGKDFDYVVGSAHYVSGIILEDHDRYFPGKSEEEAYIPYFEIVQSAAETGWFDTIAHLDLCKRYGVRYYSPFDFMRYQEQIKSILKVVIANNMTLEVNTSGLRQSPQDTYPCREILEQYYLLGGKHIIVGSDAHRVDDVGKDINQAIDLLKSVGFSTIDRYSNRRRIIHSINELSRKPA